MNSATNTAEVSNTDDPVYVSKVIKKFINNDGDDDSGKASTTQPTDGKQFHDRRDIIKALTKLQLSYKPEYIPGEEVVVNTDDFKHALLNSMAKINNSVITKSLNQIDGRTIDFVEMLFGAFMQDPNVSDTIKSLLLQLQVAIIKTAMMDKDLFSNTRHPARNMLDTIAHLGIGVDEKDSTIYKTIALVIEQLNTTFEQNIANFNTALIALNRLTTIEKSKSDEKEAETQKQFLQEYAHQTILTELKRHTKNKSLPPSLKPLMLKHMSNLMLNYYIKYGHDSDEWNNSLDMLKDLINSLQPPQSKIQYLLLKNNSEKLIGKIRDQLYSTKQDRKSIDDSLLALENIHNKLLDKKVEKEPDQVEIKTSMDDENKLRLKINRSKVELSLMPKEVKVGTWFEVFNGEGHSLRRLKLSLIVYEEAMFIFVDRVGNKVLEKHATEFLNELHDGDSKVLADHSIFHHALNNVITMLTKG